MSLSNFSSHLSRSGAVCPAPAVGLCCQLKYKTPPTVPAPVAAQVTRVLCSLASGLHMTASVVTGSLEVARLTCSEAALWRHWRLGLMLLAWSGVD